MDIKISRIRTHDAGALKAHFTLEVNGMWYRDCSYFNTGVNEWVNFPQELKPPMDGGTKPKYVAYCGYVDSTFGNEMKAKIVQAVKKEMANESTTPQVKTSEVQADPFDLPF